MRVGIVVDVYNIDHFNPNLPNPGIGGSQYMGLSLAFLLAEDFHVTVFTDSQLRLDEVRVQRLSEITNLTTEDILIVSVANFDESIDKCPARIIAWAHNTKDGRLDRLACRAERLIVNSPPQYDLLRWHSIRDRMLVIPYPFDPFAFTFQSQAEDYIVYLGALVPAKGFHHYANALSLFLLNRKTKLLVIGGVGTYNAVPGGELLVTNPEYESQFLAYVKPFVASRQVEFLGNLGIERFSIIANAKLALTNPTGSSETFCISNFECMSLGVPVLGGYHKGMTETLFPDSNLHLGHQRQIPSKINRLLDHPTLLKELRPAVRSFVEEKADNNAVLDAWKGALAGCPVETRPLSKPYLIDNKVPIWLASKLLPPQTFSRVDTCTRALRNFRSLHVRRGHVKSPLG